MKKTYLILALTFSCSSVLAANELEQKLPLTFKIATNPQKSGLCIAANSVLGNEISDFRESSKQINSVLWAVVEEKQGKAKADITEQIANEHASAMKHNIDWTISQMKSNGCSEVNREISAFLGGN